MVKFQKFIFLFLLGLSLIIGSQFLNTSINFTNPATSFASSTFTYSNVAHSDDCEDDKCTVNWGSCWGHSSCDVVGWDNVLRCQGTSASCSEGSTSTGNCGGSSHSCDGIHCNGEGCGSQVNCLVGLCNCQYGGGGGGNGPGDPQPEGGNSLE